MKPTIERIIANASSSEEALEELRKELRGEFFQDDISVFVNRDIEEFLSYRSLVKARNRWSAWSQRMSWGVMALLIVQAAFACYFLVAAKVLGHSIPLATLLATFGTSAMVFGFCLLSAVAMLYYHGQISKYRDKVL